MKKRLSLAFLAFVACASISSANNVLWGVQNTGAYQWFDHNNLAMDGTPASAAYLIQLVYAGSDGIDPIDMGRADGSGGNDIVVAFAKFGGGFSPRVDGYVNATYANSTYVNGSLFYMRAWEGTSTNANVPPTVQYYGNSMTFSMTGYDPDPLKWTDANFYATDNLGGSSGQYAMQSVVPIPEPSTFALLGLGAALIALRRRMA